MSTLTKNERDGLEDVFLSIHSKNKSRELLSLIMVKDRNLNLYILLKRAKAGLKESRFSHFFAFISKKKKFLSK
ncbi:MAG: hypothetical protein GW906_05480 [Epsilonproteobacteria bacterium]|nr:hypothetical protein [Campylobacterota bacterium]OIO18033.1 MAG: hypothetical protein AUJ81_00320 [Helicobacteraceae bacterium CG1_02_36_14]PIP09795.1 MAG: hypothetical protein COX50_08770 [Sulfurimonas sp. CG23_combo_of_CG06-09_8_20_14_all_36_33]PIS24009.1 MAG: hypothetical protein COT46_10710 [Sulfurimonas sp. CG08_land_8_20_14_0_20_36_33]PIU35493.1 MAG: hypothetical protein COT05_02850 [Sulfurimonas sp. CG07_land_8_20_14_0_80_36_56]PIV05414.1 MAG: hypothetical protein COS56_01160 [Sulfur